MCICGAWSHLSMSLWDSLLPVFPLLSRYANLFGANDHVEMPLCRGSRREDVYKIARNFAAGARGVGWPGSMPYSSPQGGCPWGGVVFSYKLRTPDSGGGLAMGGSFSATNHVLPIPRGVGHGGIVFSYRPRTPDSGDENRCPTRISLVGQVQMCVQIFPVSNLGGCAPPGC